MRWSTRVIIGYCIMSPIDGKGEGFRAPALCDGGSCAGAGVRKPPREETAGRLGTVWRARLWGFVSDGWPSSEASATGRGGCFRLRRRRWSWLMAAMRSRERFTLVDGGLRGSCGHHVHVAASGRRRKRSTLGGGMRGAGHDVSILIRIGEGDRAGRGPSNVSTTIIRPPQHWQRRANETSSA